ncbi:MAG: glycosyltransferase [Caulobacteraceae bacterium]
MKVLFIHQNMPGQFRHLPAMLARDPNNEVAFVTRRTDRDIPNVKRASYQLALPPEPRKGGLGEQLKREAFFGEGSVRACQALLARGFRPDVIIGHPGWGELLFIKDLFPDVPLVSYCEFYHDPSAPFFQGDPPSPLSLAERMSRRAQSAHLLLSLEAADRGWSPTPWQKSTHPVDLQHKIEVIFDGVDTRTVRPDQQARFELADGSSLGPEDEVITYAARSLEPCRGFPSFIRAVPHLLARRPSAHVVIAGDMEPHYDAPPRQGGTWRDVMLQQVPLDPQRVHFVGRLSYVRFVQLLQVSSVHVYLTSPIVLSWSLVEAMSAGCLIVASDTPPVRDVIFPGVNGFTTQFDKPEQIASDIAAALSYGDVAAMRTQARRYVQEHLSLDVCLPQQARMIASLAA